MKKLLLLTALCALVPAQQVLSMDSGFKVQPLLTLGAKVGFGLVGAGATIAACTVAHELGHATTAFGLFGYPINMHIGSKDVKKPLFKSKYLTINDYNIFLGNAYIPDTSYSEKKGALVGLAGPLAGIAMALLIARYTDNALVKWGAAGAVFFNSLELFPIKNSDGYHILNFSGLPEHHADKIVNVINNRTGLTAVVIASGIAAGALVKYTQKS